MTYDSKLNKLREICTNKDVDIQEVNRMLLENRDIANSTILVPYSKSLKYQKVQACDMVRLDEASIDAQ